ncbi:MAG: hypothetical protein LAT61_05595 [Alcanivorax sp.]|nr:hypothetical protein [Alcanivorax sp.]
MSTLRALNESQPIPGQDDPNRRRLWLQPRTPGRKRMSLVFHGDQRRHHYPDEILTPLRERGYFREDEPGHGKYLIPAGFGHTQRRDCDPGEINTELHLMHVRPVRFASLEPLRLSDLRNGWLYIFVNGHLWREVHVTDGNLFHDINLTRWQGQHYRPHHGIVPEARYLTLPRRLNGEAPVLEIAFSEVQWSWHTVCRMGGLAPDDIRFLPDLPVHEPWQGIAADDTLREQRCQRIDLDAYDDSWDINTLPERFLSPPVHVQQHCAQHEHTEHASDTELHPQDVNGGIAYLGLHDPLAITREIAEDYHTLLALEDTLLEQASENGAFPLALLIQKLVEEDGRRHRDKPLAEHVDQARIEQTLSDWETLARHLQTEKEHLDERFTASLREASVRTALADYFHSEHPFTQTLGVIHWSALCHRPETEQLFCYIQEVLDGQDSLLAVMADLPDPVVHLLRRLAGDERNESTDAIEHALTDQGTDYAATLGITLSMLVAALGELFTHHHTQRWTNVTADSLGKAATAISHLTGVTVQALQVPLGRVMPMPGNQPLRPDQFKFVPQAFQRAVDQLARSQVWQLWPEGKSLSEFANSLGSNPRYQTYVFRALTFLHTANLALSVRHISRHEPGTQEHTQALMAAGAATGSALAFFGGEMAKWGDNRTQRLDRQRQQFERRIARSRATMYRYPAVGIGSAQHRIAARHAMIAQKGLEKITSSSSLPEGARSLGGALRTIGLRGGGLFEVALGGWRFSEGISTDNLKVSFGGALGIAGGAMMIAGSLAFASLGVGLVLVGALIVLTYQRSDLEKALRHGYFGTRPYPRLGSPFDEPEENLLPTETGLMDKPIPLLDLSNEIDAFRKLFCQVRPSIGIHRESRPEFVPAGGRASPSSNYMIIRARIDLVGYQTGESVLNNLRLRIYHRPGFIPGKSGKEYSREALYVRPLIDGDGEYLKAVECYLRVPQSEVQGGFGKVEIGAQLDMNGDGEYLIPDSGSEQDSAWQWSDTSISNFEWENILQTSEHPTAKPETF